MKLIDKMIRVSIGILVACIGLFFLCKVYLAFMDSQVDEEYSILEDQTDPHKYRFDSKEFGKFSGLTGKGELCFVVNIMPLTQYDLNPVYSFDWLGQPPLFSNPNKKTKRINWFLDVLDDTISHVRLGFGKQDQSHLYEGLVTEYNRLATSKRKNCIMIVYSNLCQKSSLFDIYSNVDKDQLQKNSSLIIERFEKYKKPIISRKVTIYFLFQPCNVMEDEYYRLMSPVFKTVFEKAGAKVFISSNLMTYGNTF